MSNLDQIKRDTRDLSEEQRAELLNWLVETVENDVADVQSARLEEVRHRIRAADAGEVVMRPAAESIREVGRKYGLEA